MNTRGFTLVEVVAIMVILIGIFLVSFPTLNNMINSDEEKLYDTMVEDLCIAGKTYLYSHMDLYPNLSIAGKSVEIKIELLAEYGNIDKDMVNPVTEESVMKDKLKYVVLDDLSLDCKYIEE